MKKRIYEKPSIKVVELQQRSMLLAGSLNDPENNLNDPENYTNGDDPFDF